MKIRKYKISGIIVTMLFLIFTLVMLALTFTAFEDIVYYKSVLREAQEQSQNKVEIAIDFIDGLDPLDSNSEFNKNCYMNIPYSYQTGNEWLAASKALFENTNIQLYKLVLDAPVGPGTNIESETDANDYCLNYISGLPNVDNSIVLYEFRGDEVRGKWISICDKVFYGDNVIKYLRVSDIEMIEYVLNNSYDLFRDYDTRIIRTWETIGTNLSNGYNRNSYSVTTRQYTDWDIQYYKEQISASKLAFIILLIITLGCALWVCVLVYMNFIVQPRAYRAEIEAQEAESARIILETPIERMSDEADALVDKYLTEE